MFISFVVAVSENNVIGKNNELPWHLPLDLKFFKENTLGKPIIMGRNTFESIGSRPLPNRENIILSRSLAEAPDGTLLFDTLNKALVYLNDQGVSEACIIGGGAVFAESIHLAEVIYLTRVHTEIEGGTAFFPVLDPKFWRRHWKEEHQRDEKHAFDFTFEKWERIKA
jgi:dihydrofolate reductase